MQLSINTSLQQTQLNYSQQTSNQSASSAAPQLPQQLPQDRIELSDDARRPQDREHSVRHVRKTHHDRQDSPQLDLLKNIMERITGAKVSDLKSAPAAATAAAAATVPAPQSPQTSLSAQQASLSVETSSFSIDGTITTSDGAKLSFGLDLQMLHASASASALSASSNQNGNNFSFAGSAAELTSTSFSFSLTAELPDGTPATGSGSGNFSLKDDLKEVRQAMKPLVKEFLKDAGLPADKRSVNQLLHAIA